MKNKLILFGIVAVLFCILMNLCSCNLIFQNNSDEYGSGGNNMIEFHDVAMYSRDDVDIMKSSDRFGYGRSDDIYVALSFIYEDEELCNKYGNDFEIAAEDIVCVLSEGSSYFFSSFFSGEAQYLITVNQDVYEIELSKSPKGKWIIDKVSIQDEETDPMI